MARPVRKVTKSDDNDEFATFHVLAGYSNPQTMRVNRFLKRQPVTVLIDIGSTNNIMDAKIAKRLAYHIEQCEKFEVKVADGRILICESKCSNVKLSLLDQELIVDIFLLPLEDYEVILGIDWLRTLGDIAWNFAKLVMKFLLKGKQVVLKRKRREHETTVSNHSMECTLQKEHHGFFL
ncbi:RVP_2 domain-containing protein [Cephalotus follicularis]|uniref:RVP_2 domain-containing protein n=1 Tax=Cephalotus follicularis TaxID=3775 RepID=A0A1Q3AV56_CEPFO|nr:RVP_2 domain-containing protein [Cephalotus follicularis]